jgi:hypothetical protein
MSGMKLVLFNTWILPTFGISIVLLGVVFIVIGVQFLNLAYGWFTQRGF